jgi:hypothetical protein
VNGGDRGAAILDAGLAASGPVREERMSP